MKYFLLLQLLVGTGFYVYAQNELKTNADNNTLLWEVSGNGLARPSYLFGTFHLVCKEDINFSAAFKQAVTSTDKIYMELDMDDPATLLGALTLLNMKGNKSLKDLYKPAEYERIVTFFKDSLKLYVGMFQRMKPELLAALLYPKMLGCSNSISVEDAVMDLAKQQDKEIKGLETMAQQAAIFDSIPYEEQAKELLETIDSLEKSKANFNQLRSMYKNQQIDEMEKTMMDPGLGGLAGNQDVLLNHRNKNWVQQLKEILKKDAVFVAVGAGHLVGKQGLISLLRAEGYTVTALENK